MRKLTINRPEEELKELILGCVTRKVMYLALTISLAGASTPASAHCDTLDGPVVSDARTALQKGDVTPVLKWIKDTDEQGIRAVFAKTLKVRALGPDAREVADTHFFETLVRVHREGEGVAFTGLKPAGEVEPGIAAADKAIAEGTIDALAAEMGESVKSRLRERWAKVIATKLNADKSVQAGREYVAAYVEYIHFVETIHALARPAAAGPHHHIHAMAR